jgi:hypothetical protein
MGCPGAVVKTVWLSCRRHLRLHLEFRCRVERGANMICMRVAWQRCRDIPVIRTYVVGSQFYAGYLLPRERLRVVRDRQNATNRSAIWVEDARGRQIGYLPRNLTRWLAPLMDAGKVQIAAHASDGLKCGGPAGFHIRIVTLRLSPPPSRSRSPIPLPRHPLAITSRRRILRAARPADLKGWYSDA